MTRRQCVDCDGDGELVVGVRNIEVTGTPDFATIPCPACDGSGWVAGRSWLIFAQVIALYIVIQVLVTLAILATVAIAAPRSAHDPGLIGQARAREPIGAPLGDGVTTTAPGAPLAARGGASSEVEGVATWCAPTPAKCRRWGGHALLGAVPGYDGRPYWATVIHGSRRVTVHVVSICACRDRNGRETVIDLSPAAFRRLAPLSRGVIDVVLVSGDVRLPATDTEPGS